MSLICIICNKTKHKSKFFVCSDKIICLTCYTKSAEAKLQKRKYNENIEIVFIAKVKNKFKKCYPKEFSDKRRVLLDDARKNNGCTACGVRELLQVHHIDRDKFNNKDENLLVLCYYCHSKEHKHMQGKKPAKWLR